MCLARLHLTRRSSKLQASNWTPGFTEWRMLNLAYIKRESSGQLLKLYSLPFPPLLFCFISGCGRWPPALGLKSQVGSQQGAAGGGMHLPFKRRQTATASHNTAAVQGPAGGRSGVTEIDNVVEKWSFAKGLWLPPAGVSQIPGRCSLLSPTLPTPPSSPPPDN